MGKPQDTIMLLKSNVNDKPERYLAVPLAFTANSPNDPNREQTINIFCAVNNKNTKPMPF